MASAEISASLLNHSSSQANQSPRDSQQATQQSVKFTTEIAAAAALKRLGNNLLCSVASYFDINPSKCTAKPPQQEVLINDILAAAAKLNSSTTTYLDTDISPDTICCFDSSGVMLCTMLSFDPTAYSVALPSFLHEAAANLSLVDRVKLLSQGAFFSNPESNGIAELLWTDLTIPQMYSTLSFMGVSFNRQDAPRDLKRRLYSHISFSKTHGAADKVALFSFSSDSPHDCIAVSSQPLEANCEEYKLTLKLITENVKNVCPMITQPENSSNFNCEPSNESTESFSSLSQNDRSRIQSGSDLISTSSCSLLADEDSIDLNCDDSDTYCCDSFRTPTISACDFDFSIAPRKNNGIIDDYCTKCNADATNLMLTCYLCNLTVHYPCYRGKDQRGTSKKGMSKTAFETIGKLRNNKWFCNGCSKISMADILEKISQYAQKKVDETVENELSKCNIHHHDAGHDTPSVMSRASTPDYSKTDPYKTILSLKESITQEIRAALKEDIRSLITHIKDPSLQDKGEIMSKDMDKASMASYANVTSKPLVRNGGGEDNATAQINRSKKTTTHLDPKMSVIIKHVSNKKVAADDTCLKSEFNKLFNRMKIKYCKKTRYGNIILQLTSENDIAQVLSNWKPEYLKGSDAKIGTQVYRMSDQHLFQNATGIVRYVPVEIETASITRALDEAGFTKSHVVRLSKSSSIKVVFNSQEDLARAIKEGFGIEHLWLNVEEFTFSKKPMQCHGCKRFGHPVKWCRSKKVCGFCSENHSDKDCTIKTDSSKHHCSNCEGNHSALSTSCPQHKLKLSLILRNIGQNEC